MNNKKLYRSCTDKKLCGVCGGIAEYLECDPTVVRLIWILATVFVGFGLLGYLICALLIPADPRQSTTCNQQGGTKPPCEY